jgi:hypothetical protein
MEDHELTRLAADLAPGLPDGWDALHRADDPGAIHGPDAMRLVLSSSAWGGLFVTGKLPVEYPLADVPGRLRRRCRIRLSRALDATAVADAIVERLFPVYIPLFADLARRAACPRAAHHYGTSSSPALPHEVLATSDASLLSPELVQVTLLLPRDRLPRFYGVLRSIAP